MWEINHHFFMKKIGLCSIFDCVKENMLIIHFCFQLKPGKETRKVLTGVKGRLTLGCLPL